MDEDRHSRYQRLISLKLDVYIFPCNIHAMYCYVNCIEGEEIGTGTEIETEIETIMTEEEVEEEEGRWSEHSEGGTRRRRMTMRNLANQVSGTLFSVMFTCNFLVLVY